MNENSTNLELSIVIVNYNSGEYLKNCLKSIEKHINKISYEIIVVDNCSTDGSEKGLKNYNNVKLIKSEKNYGFAKANNVGVSAATGEYILILNNDTIFFDNSIKVLLEYKKNHPEIGILSPVILYEDKSFQLSFGYDINLFSEFFLKYFGELYFKLLYKIKNNNFIKKTDWISGACFLIEKKLYESVSGFDENFFLYMEDADFGRRIRNKGYELIVYGKAKIIHLKGKTSSKNMSIALIESKKSQLYYYCKHNSKFSIYIIKKYLKIKFKIKYYLSGDNKKIIKKLLRIIDEYRC